MEITKTDWEGTVEALAHARLRPQMWFASDMLAIMNFRLGLIFGLGTFGIDIQNEEMRVAAERGWKVNAHHPIRDMQEKGMSEAEINVEMITMLILAIQRLFHISDEPILKTHAKMRDSILHTQNDMQNTKSDELSVYNNPAVVDLTRSRNEVMTQLLDRIEREMQIK
jgi:hypothetical protein